MTTSTTYLDLENGIPTQQSATVSSSGAGDANKIPRLDASGRLAQNMMPTGIVPDTKDFATLETITLGNIINIDATGVRKADATAANKFKGVGFVIAGFTHPTTATVYFEGVITGLSGLTIGAEYYLSESAGAVTAVAPSTSGAIVQRIGVAISATELSFEPAQPIVLA
jgi:hypothetical protein